MTLSIVGIGIFPGGRLRKSSESHYKETQEKQK